MDNRLFPETARPFLEKLKENTIKAGIPNVEDYIKLRKWKVRAGGDRFNSSSELRIKSINPDFSAEVINPKENVFEWIKTIGSINYHNSDFFVGELKYKKIVYAVKFSFEENGRNFSLSVKNTGTDMAFVGLLRRVLQKTTHCVHCEVCEVECPTGALSVVPIVKIDERKCIKCHRCLEFIDNGCEVANSIKKTVGISVNNTNKNDMTTLNKYNTFGFRERWLAYYLENAGTYFKDNTHGLNVTKQLPVFKKWLTDAEIIQKGSETITEKGKLFVEAYGSRMTCVWEIIWITLCNNSELFSWYIGDFAFGREYARTEMDSLLGDMFPQYTPSVRENAMKAFQNTFKESPLSSAIPVGYLTKKGSKVYFNRRPHSNISLVAVAYSLFRYAERQKRYSLTVSEFYDENQREGIYRQFGISKDTFARLLLSLQEENNHVLRAELNMGLDNIILRDDLKAIDILKLML